MTAARESAADSGGTRARRLRLLTILAIAASAALTLLAVTQPWWTVAIGDTALEVVGTVASPGLSALSLASFALAAALAISGPVFRVILGVLQGVIGFTVVLAAATSLSDPVAASASLISEATGVAGSASVPALVDGVSATVWPWLAIASGALSLLVGVWLLLTFRRWPAATRKYDAVRLEPEPETDPDAEAATEPDTEPDTEAATEADPAARGASATAVVPRDRVGDWDALSDGKDPTER